MKVELVRHDHWFMIVIVNCFSILLGFPFCDINNNGGKQLVLYSHSSNWSVAVPVLYVPSRGKLIEVQF